MSEPAPERSCPMCGGASRAALVKNGFEIVECSACRHRFTILAANREEHVAQVYGDAYFEDDPGGVPHYTSQESVFRARGRAYSKILRRYGKPGRMLDVGAAAGFILEGFHDGGWTGEGIEPNASMASFGSQKFGRTIHVGSFESLAADAQYDLISALQVVAHFTDPVEAFRKMSELLVPGGLLLVETWNVRSYSSRVFGKHWHEYNPPSVLHYYNPPSLVEHLKRDGLKLIARGRPLRWILGHHARTILSRIAGGFPGAALWRLPLKLIPDRLAVPYPPEDLFWMLFRKES